LNHRLCTAADKAASKAGRLARSNAARRRKRRARLYGDLYQVDDALLFLKSEAKFELDIPTLVYRNGNAARSLVRRLNFECNRWDIYRMWNLLPYPELPTTADTDLRDLEAPTRVLRRANSGSDVSWPFRGPKLPSTRNAGLDTPGQSSLRAAALCDCLNDGAKCRYRVFQSFAVELGSLDRALEALEKTPCAQSFTDTDVEAVRQASEFEDEWESRQQDYVAMVNAWGLQVARGELGGIEECNLQYLNGGINVPKRFRQRYYVIGLVRDEQERPAFFDFYSTRYLPLFQVALRLS